MEDLLHDSARTANMSAGMASSRPKSRITSLATRQVDAESTLGQLSLAPTTQTTVVTTTTTTTTNFPPFLIRPPKRLGDLDTRMYPLADALTPVALKNIPFTLEGKPMIFKEADDTTLAIEQFRGAQQNLQDVGGTLRTIYRSEPWTDDELFDSTHIYRSSRGNVPERPVSPESNAGFDDLNEGLSVANRTRLVEKIPSRSRRDTRGRPRPRHGLQLRDHQLPEPMTPGLDSSPLLEEDGSHHGGAQALALCAFGRQTPRSSGRSLSSRNRFTAASQPQCSAPVLKQENASACTDLQLQPSVVPTPPVDADDTRSFIRPPSRRAITSVPARLNMNNSSSVPDGSLPSPSLSPVTAAATQNPGYFADVDSNSEVASQHGQNGSEYASSPQQSSFDEVRQFSANDSRYFTLAHMQNPNSAPLGISTMLDAFEEIPDELKSYVMHQLLRRCPKPTLHLVADVVNPALKCDFLTILPIELGLNVLRYLDVRSLCKASQVSKKWRHMINGDECAWKQLFDADGLVLPVREMERAVAEGWAWQDPHGPDGHEQDLSLSAYPKSDSDALQSRPSSGHAQGAISTTGLRRSKRKAASSLSSSSRSKQMKRKQRVRHDDHDSIDWMSQLSTAESPHQAASEAARAGPFHEVGLPSLKGMHLYKSLYRRHHVIRRNWMQEDTKPHHIAFRAHDRHVVTCLQFDTDKILTGSDDYNINVYDTKTGALRTKLKGHEGGVWALQYEGNVLVSGSTDRSVRVWDIEQGKEMQVFRGHTSTVRCLQILMPAKVGETADGKAVMMPKQPLIITGSRDSSLRIWKLPRPGDPVYIQPDTGSDDGECPYFVRALTGHQHSVRAIAAHADTLVSGSYDYVVRVWRISTGETIHRLQGHTQKVYSVVLDHLRNRCISGSMDNMVKIWSLDTGSLLHTLDGHSSLVGLLDLNCERLVSAAADSTLRIWDPENGQCKATLSAHTGAITCFQHDAQKVISGSDRTLKMWNVKTGECVKDLLSDLSGVWQVKFNERRCVAAVQRENLTYIEVLDFGAARDGVPEHKRGRRIVVDEDGCEQISEDNASYMELDGEMDS